MMILLLAQNSLQERTLGITLKLGGHDAHVVNDEFEAINMIKTVPKEVRGLVIGGAGCEKTLAEKLSVLSNNQICTPIYLVGLAGKDAELVKFNKGIEHALKLSICKSDELLECLNNKKITRQQ